MASSPQHEPTMEEILASIRKIISEDAPDAVPAAPVVAAATPVAAPMKAPEPEEAEVFELTQEIREEPAPVAQAPKPADDVVFETVQEAPVVASNPSPNSSNDSIFSDKTRKAVEDTFAKIDVPPPEAPRAKPAPSFAPVDGNTVEAVFERAVREAVGPHIDQWMDGNKDELLAGLRPLIREWMDDHFPALLEGAVRDEVARAVKARGR
jgi:hypothetical protein